MEFNRHTETGLSSVYWIGGSFSGGKTTTCRLLAEKFDLQPYHYDRHLLQDPAFIEFQIADNTNWFWLPVDQKLDEYKGVFQTAINQITELTMSGPVIVEGPGLLPELLSECQVRPSRALFFLPTPAHQRSANRGRGDWVDDVLARADDPERTWESWMDLDEEFARLLSRSAGDQGYGVLWNDGTRSPDEFALLAERHFRL